MICATKKPRAAKAQWSLRIHSGEIELVWLVALVFQRRCCFFLFFYLVFEDGTTPRITRIPDVGNGFLAKNSQISWESRQKCPSGEGFSPELGPGATLFQRGAPPPTALLTWGVKGSTRNLDLDRAIRIVRDLNGQRRLRAAVLLQP